MEITGVITGLNNRSNKCNLTVAQVKRFIIHAAEFGFPNPIKCGLCGESIRLQFTNRNEPYLERSQIFVNIQQKTQIPFHKRCYARWKKMGCKSECLGVKP